MPKLKIDLDHHVGRDTSELSGLESITAGLPSVSNSKATALKSAPRVQFSFTNVPAPIKEAFDAEASRRGITKKELLYHCLKSGGIDVPDAFEVDARRRN